MRKEGKKTRTKFLQNVICIDPYMHTFCLIGTNDVNYKTSKIHNIQWTANIEELHEKKAMQGQEL